MRIENVIMLYRFIEGKDTYDYSILHFQEGYVKIDTICIRDEIGEEI